MDKLKSEQDLRARFCWETGLICRPTEHEHPYDPEIVLASCYREWTAQWQSYFDERRRRSLAMLNWQTYMQRHEWTEHEQT